MQIDLDGRVVAKVVHAESLDGRMKGEIGSDRGDGTHGGALDRREGALSICRVELLQQLQWHLLPLQLDRLARAHLLDRQIVLVRVGYWEAKALERLLEQVGRTRAAVEQDGFEGRLCLDIIPGENAHHTEHRDIANAAR